jgi:hypothetical protein
MSPPCHTARSEIAPLCAPQSQPCHARARRLRPTSCAPQSPLWESEASALRCVKRERKKTRVPDHSHNARAAIALPSHGGAEAPRSHGIQFSIQVSFSHPKRGKLAALPVKRLRQMEAFSIVLPLNFLQPCAGGAASSPHFIKPAKHCLFNAFAIGLIKMKLNSLSALPCSIAQFAIHHSRVMPFFSRAFAHNDCTRLDTDFPNLFRPF